MDIGGLLGRTIGILLAPAAALGSFLRGARVVHPDGMVYRADVDTDVLESEGALGRLADRLSGPALVRLSAAMRRQEPGTSPPDVLGIALRFNASPVDVPAPGSRSQDLLLISVQHLWQLPRAALLASSRDFLAKDYYAIAPFRVEGLGVVKFRLVPYPRTAGGHVGGSRRERLERAVRQGRAVLRLEIQGAATGAEWVGLSTVTLQERVDIDQAALRFSPFHDGAGIEPVGFVQGLRWAVYPASQLGRELSRRLRRGR